MKREAFQAILPLKVTSIIEELKKSGLSDDDAIGGLYNSKLYESLQREDTKMWWYSPGLLADLLKEEFETGKFTYPDN